VAILEAVWGENIGRLVIDHHMPQTNGSAVTGQVRAKGTNTPVALMCGAVSPAVRAQAAELDIGTVLEEPLDEDRLFTFVATCPLKVTVRLLIRLRTLARSWSSAAQTSRAPMLWQ
jgi:DNA-binding NtrC family response regulator